jgi:hypothetical protein
MSNIEEKEQYYARMSASSVNNAKEKGKRVWDGEQSSC